MDRTSYCLMRQDARPEYWTAMRVYGVTPEALLAGAPLEGVEEPVRVTLSAWAQGYTHILERPGLVVSDEIRKVLERAGVDNIQYFEAQLHIEFAEEPIRGYWLANVIGMVSCVDPDASTFEPSFGSETGELRGFEVDPAQTYGLSLFRLAEDPRLVVVSNRVRAALEATHLRGLLFQETRTYDGYQATSEPPPAEERESE
ncbi:MAG: hypothetical protein JWN04_2826 [Myxococcaceae bacterium]|nr:hypothetical protein [Myxococcaceae bacterium]